jgi:tripartite-type tricarboxylate transporter receptor subunit TctC
MPFALARQPRPARATLGHLRRRRVVVASLATIAARRSLAQSPWPQRPVRIVSMLPPGQVADTLSRVLAARFAAVFGQPFVIENRLGAGGTIAAAAVAQATDGHTLGLVVGGPTTTARALNPDLAYDPASAFAPVSLLVRTPLVLTVHPGLPARRLADFVAHVRANPGRLSYASIGPGTVSHLWMEELKARLGLEMEHVAYRGFPAANLDLLAGRVQAMLNLTSMAAPSVRDGRLVALAHTGEGRLDFMPDLPSLEEEGLAEMGFFGWTGLIAPAGFPPAAAERLAAIARDVLAHDPEAQRLRTDGVELLGTAPAALARLQEREAARWNAVIERLGLRVTD